ncbi:MAG: right-handed parallel beta-helix repeat-containing protein [Thermoleophilia bacterium]
MPVWARTKFPKHRALLLSTGLAGVMAVIAVPGVAQQYGGSTTSTTTTTTTAPSSSADLPAPIAPVSFSCDKFAAPGGSDGAAGTAANPYKTAQKLQDSLKPGQVGCLKPGAVFQERLRANGNGRPGAPITMTSGPGAGRATLLGELYVPADASDYVYANLKINGRTSFRVNPSVNGDRITFSNNDVTDEHHGICFHLGKPGEGVAENIVIDGNRIHDCGRMPSTGFDHAIYLNQTRNVRITNNYIYDNADYGVHMYPSAQGTLVANNVIDGNGRGVTFSGEGSQASNNNVVTNNIISNSRDTTNIESYWGGPVGTGNRAEDNCLFNGAKGNIGQQRGFTLSNNKVANPDFVNRAAKNFALSPGSPCAGKGPGNPLPAIDPTPASGSSGGGASSGGGSAISSPKARAARLKLGTSWIASGKLRVSATSKVAGRVTMRARIGSRAIGGCTKRVLANRTARCVFGARSRVTVTVTLRPSNSRLGVSRKTITRNPK